MTRQAAKNDPVQFIVTRPASQQESLLSQLRALIEAQKYKCSGFPLQQTKSNAFAKPSSSYRVEYFPLIAIKPHRSELLGMEFSLWDGVIFISKNAVRHLKDQLTEAQWRILLTRPLYTVGKATAALVKTEVEDQHIKNDVIFPETASTEGLLSLDALQDISTQHWMIVKGVEGREKLRSEMNNKGALIVEQEVYQRVLPSSEIQEGIRKVKNVSAIWIVTSVQALKNLAFILDSKHQDCRVITSSDRISHVARLSGFEIVAQSLNATDEALVSCIEKLLAAQVERSRGIN